ncbi:3-ketoacyl-CoA reductase [Tricholoma matsutake]|nr:3-ketoacyl-CoA reductase [Tricholoma matsutake 945]
MDAEQLQELPNLFVRNHPYFSTFLLALGFWSVARSSLKSFAVILQIFVLPGISLNRFGAKKDAWAVVTGASDGIGKEFAFQLAKAGFNIFLVARNKGLLDSTAAEIERKFPGVSTATYAIDLALKDDVAHEGFATVTDGLDIGVLVNNVGRSHSMPVYFHETSREEMSDIVALNVNATLRVTYSILPGMIKRKRGLILNIGSFAGAIPSPMLATYSGTKAFLSTFTSALAEEVKSHNIIVEHVNTYFVVSKLSKIRKPSVMVPLPGTYVRSVLSKIGLACGAAFSGRLGTSTPYWSHALLDYGMTLIGLPGVYVRYTHGLHKDIRRRALRKLEKEGKNI